MPTVFNYYWFYLILVGIALVSYICGSVNFAIIMSKALYHEDIRTKGSGNPGFTNFKRTYGNKFSSWMVLVLDWMKTLVPVMVTALCFKYLIDDCMWQFGAEFSGFCCMLGHCFPIFYKFKGGKAFIAGAATLFFVDYRVGLICLAIFMLLLFTVRYMSIASCVFTFLGPIGISLFNIPNFIDGQYICYVVMAISICSAMLVILRHYPNFIKLKNHQESKFYLHSKK